MPHGQRVLCPSPCVIQPVLLHCGHTFGLGFGSGCGDGWATSIDALAAATAAADLACSTFTGTATANNDASHSSSEFHQFTSRSPWLACRPAKPTR